MEKQKTYKAARYLGYDKMEIQQLPMPEVDDNSVLVIAVFPFYRNRDILLLYKFFVFPF